MLHNLQVLYMCTLCDSTNINTIIEFVPNFLYHVSMLRDTKLTKSAKNTKICY